MSEPITGPWPVGDPEYFQDATCVSNSMMRVFNRSVVEYHGRFITGTISAPKPSAEMRLGTLLHAALLEPERWSDRRAGLVLDGRTKAGKLERALHEEYQKVHPECLTVTDEEEAAVLAMHAAVMAKPEAADALALPGICEGPIRWQDETSGLWLKAKPDKACSNGLILDLKTSADPRPEAFARSCVNFGYDMQCAHYLAGCWQAVRADGPFAFLVVGNRPPHEVGLYVLDAEAVELGRKKITKLLSELAECYSRNQWPSRLQGIQELSLPRWAFANIQLED